MTMFEQVLEPAAVAEVAARTAETEPAPARELPMDGQVLLHVVGLGGDSSGPDTEGELRTPTEDTELAKHHAEDLATLAGSRAVHPW